MPSEKLDRAIGAIQVRFGDRALVRGTRLPRVTPWPTGQPAIDRLSGIGGAPARPPPWPAPAPSFLLVLAELLEADLARLESCAARSARLVVAEARGAQRALAHASSLTLELERVAWTCECGLIVRVRSVVRCVKNTSRTEPSRIT
jgi:hypothetical protein